MSYKTRFIDEAKVDLDYIEEYLSQFYPSTALKFFEQMEKQVAHLEENPYMYPAYEDNPFFRKMVIDEYLLFYNVDDERSLIIIYLVIHSKRDISTELLENRVSEDGSL